MTMFLFPPRLSRGLTSINLILFITLIPSPLASLVFMKRQQLNAVRELTRTLLRIQKDARLTSNGRPTYGKGKWRLI